MTRRSEPLRRVYIPKPGTTKQRLIGVPSIRDRALQGAVAEILSQIYEVDFEPQSFGGRPQLSAHHAVINLQTQVTVRKTKYILNCDLENFFGSVSHEWVMRFLSHRVKDPRILNLVLRWLRAGVMEQGRFQETEIGVPQGGPISVLLSNLYLHYALDLWLNRTIKPRLRGQMEFIRYLDDFVILLDREDDLRRLQEVLPKRLEKFSLRTNESKSQVLKFGAAMAQCHDVLHYLGFTLYRTRNRKGGHKIGFKTEKKRLHRALGEIKREIRTNRYLTIPEQHKRILRFMRGHFNYYGIGNNDSGLWATYKTIFYYWRKQLCRRSQKGRYLGKRYLKMLKSFPLCPIRLRIRYQDFHSYLML